jgi:uncharacterized protein YecE (DUF72 family)
VWCFFDNDVKSAAPHDAQRLIDFLNEESEVVPAGAKRRPIATIEPLDPG